MKRETHNITPVYQTDSRVLLLGSFPSPKSREVKFYYGNPQNRFWKVISGIYADKIPETEKEKKEILSKHKIALFDVIAECDIEGASDSSIKNVVVNDIASIITETDVQAIFFNGKTAARLFERHYKGKLDLPVFTMPSTSPANASYSLEALIEEWSKIKEYTN